MNMLPIAPPRHPARACSPAAQIDATVPVEGERPDTPTCGWFESSWDLQQGLAVSELQDSDGSVAALWFTRLVSSPARLQ